MEKEFKTLEEIKHCFKTTEELRKYFNKVLIDCNLNHTEFANALGVSPQAVNNWLSKGSQPNFVTIDKVQQVTYNKINVNFFMWLKLLYESKED